MAHRLLGSGIPRLADLLLAPRKMLFDICENSSDVAEIEKELRYFLRERTSWNGWEEDEVVKEDEPNLSQIDGEGKESVFDLSVCAPFDSTPLGQSLGIDFLQFPPVASAWFFFL